MDTSKEYIKMCAKAREIQKWTHKDLTQFDYICPKEEDEVISARDVICGLEPKYHIWLPRQDQLQEIMNPPIGFIARLNEFNFWHDNEKVRYLNKFNSMEQLWLAFVMKEKYNKAWNGKRWTLLKNT